MPLVFFWTLRSRSLCYSACPNFSFSEPKYSNGFRLRFDKLNEPSRGFILKQYTLQFLCDLSLLGTLINIKLHLYCIQALNCMIIFVMSKKMYEGNLLQRNWKRDKNQMYWQISAYCCWWHVLISCGWFFCDVFHNHESKHKRNISFSQVLWHKRK